VSLVGRPNVGKSSLLNRAVGHKISITSRRPQTTRHRVIGIKSTSDSQIVFVDTPGIHTRQSKALNRAINRSAVNSLHGVDLLALVISAKGWVADDDESFRLVSRQSCPTILIINKSDLLKDKDMLLPLIDISRQRMEFAAIIPVSAKTGWNVDYLVTTIGEHLPVNIPGFAQEQITDKSERFMAGELVREQLFRQLGEELPYATAVQVEDLNDNHHITIVRAVIWVERQGQKAMVIGQHGGRLKSIGTAARKEIEQCWNRRIHLELRVKVQSGWTDKPAALRDLGYCEES